MQDTGKSKLQAHSNEFRRDIIKVTDGVYVAIGYAGANSTLLDGEDGVVIVDTLEGIEAAEAVKAEFDKLTSKPVKAIIYTHFHGDHTGGASVFAKNSDPEIISSSSLMDFKVPSPVGKILGIRGRFQFGHDLPDSERLNYGIGPAIRLRGGAGEGWMPPTKTFSEERHIIHLSGLEIELVKAPGETDDHIFVWLPTKKVLLCGDNYYKAFPNISPIRGSPYRDVVKWADSLDKIISQEPEYLIPGHTRPISGSENVKKVLINYRDAIRGLYEQTIDGMNQGLTPDELVKFVKLPPHLVNEPCLQEYYGTLDWAVRSIFTGHVGWFDGNPTNVFPLPPYEYAQRIADLAGGVEELMKRTREAFEEQDYQWVLHLADLVHALDPEMREALVLKARAMKELGESQINATARNYYLTASRRILSLSH